MPYWEGFDNHIHESDYDSSASMQYTDKLDKFTFLSSDIVAGPSKVYTTALNRIYRRRFIDILLLHKGNVESSDRIF